MSITHTHNYSELPFFADYRSEIFTGSWVNVHSLNTEGYPITPTKEMNKSARDNVTRYFKDLKLINIKDLPFDGITRVTLHKWNYHHLVLEYLGNFYKINNFTPIRGVTNVKIRRTKYKGYLTLL